MSYEKTEIVLKEITIEPKQIGDFYITVQIKPYSLFFQCYKVVGADNADSPPPNAFYEHKKDRADTYLIEDAVCDLSGWISNGDGLQLWHRNDQESNSPIWIRSLWDIKNLFNVVRDMYKLAEEHVPNYENFDKDQCFLD